MLSPSTRRLDLLLERDRLQQAGCPSSWLVDPDVPSVVVLELVDGEYAEGARVSGGEAAHLPAPFPVTVVPADLLDG